MALLAAILLVIAAELSWASPKRQSYFRSGAFSPDGKLLALIGSSTIYLWDVVAGGQPRILRLSHRAAGTRVAFSGDDRALATGSVTSVLSGDAVVLWDLATGYRLRGFLRAAVVDSVALSADGSLLAAGTFGLLPGRKLRVWDLRSGREVPVPAYRGVDVGDLAFSPDGSRLAIRDVAGVCVVDIPSGREEWRYPDRRNSTSVSFSPDGNLLATTHADGTVRLWDVRTWKVQVIVAGHAGPMGKGAFSPDGSTIATAGPNANIVLWDVANGRQLRELHARGGGPLAFSPEGKTLASASFDGTLTLWDVETGREIRSVTLFEETSR